MKLLVIVLCLLSERYLVHAVSASRFYWFSNYCHAISTKLLQTGRTINSYLMLAIVIAPLLLSVGLMLLLTDTMLAGLISLLLNIAIFYYGLGPENSFYPTHLSDTDNSEQAEASHYFAKVNHQLFAVMLWFIVAGGMGVVCYRLLSLSQKEPLLNPAAERIVGGLDWISARITVLLYLLVGNFQQGFHYYRQMFFAAPEQNDAFLGTGGLLAARIHDDDKISLPYAQNLVEHALIVFLVFIAFFTLTAWL